MPGHLQQASRKVPQNSNLALPFLVGRQNFAGSMNTIQFHRIEKEPEVKFFIGCRNTPIVPSLHQGVSSEGIWNKNWHWLVQVQVLVLAVGSGTGYWLALVLAAAAVGCWLVLVLALALAGCCCWLLNTKNEMVGKEKETGRDGNWQQAVVRMEGGF